MLTTCAEPAEASQSPGKSEAIGMLHFVQHDNSAWICKEDVLLDVPRQNSSLSKSRFFPPSSLSLIPLKQQTAQDYENAKSPCVKSFLSVQNIFFCLQRTRPTDSRLKLYKVRLSTERRGKMAKRKQRKATSAQSSDALRRNGLRAFRQRDDGTAMAVWERAY